MTHGLETMKSLNDKRCEEIREEAQAAVEAAREWSKQRAEKLIQTLLYAAPETHQGHIEDALLDAAIEWPWIYRHRTAGDSGKLAEESAPIDT